MKTLVTIIALIFSIQAHADVEFYSLKDWSAYTVDSHTVSDKEACLAMTKIKNKETYLEVYAEKNAQGGYVQPMVQIVSTQLPAALAVVASIDGTKLPMTISLKETKEITVPGPFPTKVEQQVFVGRFKDKESMISLIRRKNRFQATFYDGSGRVARETFSLRGSSKTVKNMMDRCL